jgi:hypothetical protein
MLRCRHQASDVRQELRLLLAGRQSIATCIFSIG